MEDPESDYVTLALPEVSKEDGVELGQPSQADNQQHELQEEVKLKKIVF